MEVIAASNDFRADVEKIVTNLKLSFPVAYELDPAAISEATGAFYDCEDEEPYLHATSFILNEATVETAIYSTGSLGRLTAEDTLRYTRDLP